MNKNKYELLEMDVVLFDAEDVVTGSGMGNNDPTNIPPFEPIDQWEMPALI